MLEPRTEIPVPADAVGDSPASVAIDLPCMSCGYNLRTLPTYAVCPECAAPVRRTVAAAAQRTSVELYLLDLYQAAMGLTALLLVLLMALVADFLLYIQVGIAGFTLLMAMIAAPFGLMGVLVLTRPPGRPPGHPANTSARRTARWSLVAIPLGVWVALIGLVSGVLPLFALATVITGGAFALMSVALARHLASVARWLGALRLERGLTRLAVAHVVVPGVAWLSLPLLGIRIWPPGPAPLPAMAAALVLVAAWYLCLRAFARLVRPELKRDSANQSALRRV